MKSHDDLRALVPIFALDALPAEDETELVSHLKVCRECSESLAQHRETAGMLGLAAGSRQAPGDLRDRILQQAAQTAQVRSMPSARGSKAPARPAGRSVRWQWVGLAAAAVLALVIGGIGVQRINERDERLTEQQIVIGRQREALDVISSPDSIVLTMSPTEELPGVHGKAFVSDQDESAAVVVAGLSAPGGDDVYTLWLIAGDDPVPVTDFVPEDGLALLPVDRAVGSDATLAVTHEPNPGNSSPQGPVVMAAYRA